MAPTATIPPASAGGPTLLERLRDCTQLLEAVAADRSVLSGVPSEQRRRLLEAVALVYSPDRAERRRMARVMKRRRKAARVSRDEGVRADTGIRALRRPAAHSPKVIPPAACDPGDAHAQDPGRGTAEPQTCYICKDKYAVVHHFYDQLCPSCAELNFAKRGELADLRGRVALLTGGRVKIGYQAGLKLLRAGARLIVTTRFPRDCALRYAREEDFGEWADRLEVFGLDLRHTPSVEAFCAGLLATERRLDYVVNNACQTVRRPPEFYAHMMAAETAAGDMPEHVRRLIGVVAESRQPGMASGPAVPAPSDPRASQLAGLVHAARMSQVPLLADERTARWDLFPAGQLDGDLQQVDLRSRNSWRMLLDEVPAVELLEVLLVNATAPFIINARLKPLMLRTPGRDKHIVNVSAVEGQFYRSFKTTRHPHTNMAKAALNMMTRTAAADYHNHGIHMNSVDTGWVTDEDPIEIAVRKTAEQRFHPPLDSIDGAARIVDPIVSGVNTGTHVWGQFLKDYRPANW